MHAHARLPCARPKPGSAMYEPKMDQPASTNVRSQKKFVRENLKRIIFECSNIRCSSNQFCYDESLAHPRESACTYQPFTSKEHSIEKRNSMGKDDEKLPRLTWPQARPMPRSSMPWGHDRFSSKASAPAAYIQK